MDMGRAGSTRPPDIYPESWPRIAYKERIAEKARWDADLVAQAEYAAWLKVHPTAKAVAAQEIPRKRLIESCCGPQSKMVK